MPAASSACPTKMWAENKQDTLGRAGYLCTYAHVGHHSQENSVQALEEAHGQALNDTTVV